MTGNRKPPYEVGYGRPPKEHQYRPGQSGNRGGRPKNARNTATIVSEALTAKVKLKENGRTRSVAKVDVAMTQLANKAAAGDLKAIALVLNLYREVEANAANRSEPVPLDSADREILSMLLEKVRSSRGNSHHGR